MAYKALSTRPNDLPAIAGGLGLEFAFADHDALLVDVQNRLLTNRATIDLIHSVSPPSTAAPLYLAFRPQGFYFTATNSAGVDAALNVVVHDSAGKVVGADFFSVTYNLTPPGATVRITSTGQLTTALLGASGPSIFVYSSAGRAYKFTYSAAGGDAAGYDDVTNALNQTLAGGVSLTTLTSAERAFGFSLVA